MPPSISALRPLQPTRVAAPTTTPEQSMGLDLGVAALHPSCEEQNRLDGRRVQAENEGWVFPQGRAEVGREACIPSQVGGGEGLLPHKEEGLKGQKKPECLAEVRKGVGQDKGLNKEAYIMCVSQGEKSGFLNEVIECGMCFSTVPRGVSHSKTLLKEACSCFSCWYDVRSLIDLAVSREEGN